MNSFEQFYRKATGSLFLAREVAGQTRIPYWPPERLNAVRDARVRAMVAYAAQTVPHYRDQFKRMGFDPRDIRIAADLSLLPVVEKQQVQAESERFLSDSSEGKTAFCMPTSGTSGLQLNVYQSQRYLLANAAWGERQLAAIRELLGPGVPFRQVSIAYPNNSLHKVRGQVRKNAFVLNRTGVRVLSLLDPLETIIDQINHLRPNLLTAYGTFIELLFKTVNARGIKMHMPKAVMYVSDHLSEDTQQMIQNKYGVGVISSYTAVEAFKIGFTCSHHKGFHLHNDLMQLRIVNDAGEDMPTGESGDVVITNLMNRGTVLLNYRLGDRGRLTTEPCTCGRTLPLLAKLEGRRDDVIELANGHYLHSAAVWLALRDNHDFIQYQLIQHTRNTFELKLVTVDLPTFEHTSADLLTRLQPLLGPEAQITVTYMNPSAPFGERKRSQLVSLVKSRPAATPPHPTGEKSVKAVQCPEG